MSEAGRAVMRHGREISEGEGIRQWPVFLEAFLQITSLHVMKSPRVSTVMSGEDSAFGVGLQSKGIAAAFGEDFEAAALRMITPNKLAHGVQERLPIQSGTHHMPGDGAALRRVKPAVRTPAQTVCHGVRVLQAES